MKEQRGGIMFSLRKLEEGTGNMIDMIENMDPRDGSVSVFLGSGDEKAK